MTKYLFFAGLLSVLWASYFGIGVSFHDASSDATNKIPTPTPLHKSYVRGKIFYPDGKLAADVHVSTFKRNPPPDDAVREFNPTGDSENNGEYEVEFSKPGTYDLCPWKQAENYLLPNTLPYGISLGGKCETVTITQSEGERIERNLTLAPQVNSLRGKISDWKAMYRLNEATIVVYRPLKRIEEAKGEVKFVLTTLEEAEWDARAEVKPNNKGEFVVNGLPEGDYFLRLEFPDQETWFYKTGSDKDPTPIHVRNKAKNEIEFSFYEMSGRAVVKVKKPER